MLLMIRIAWRQIARSAFQRSPALRRRVAVIGSNQAAHRICAQMRRSHAGVDVVGIYDNSAGGDRLTGIGPAGVVGMIDELISLCRAEPIDDILITLPWSDEDKIDALVRQLSVVPCGVHLCPGILGERFAAGKMGIVGDTHALEISARSMEGWATIWKIVQDQVLAGLVSCFFRRFSCDRRVD